jgi:YhcH/YjgK/YiaL family protein
MIFDQIANFKKYFCIPNHDHLVDFLDRHDLKTLSPGEIEIKGKDLFVKVQHYTPQEAEKNKFETHRIYADIQMMVRGCEAMHVVRPQQLTPLIPYDPQGDFQFFHATQEVTPLLIRENEFIYFPPGQPHKPGCRYGPLPEPVIKLVFKTRVLTV